MARYIDADQTIKDIRKLAEKHHSNGEYEFANGVIKAITRITSQPTSDVKEVVRGNWIPDYEDEKCSNCGFCFRNILDSDSDFSIDFNIKEMNFCPHCRADMRGDK